MVSASTASRSPDSVLSAGPSAGRLNLDKATIPQLQRAMNSGRFSSVELTRFYLERIRRLNPKLHAVITTNPDAVSEAAASDQRRHEGKTLGPIDGISVLLKDNIDTHDRQGTTAGSLALAQSRPAADAFLVQRLRAAGAVIIGKANLSEWANFRSSQSSSGWSAVGGQTANPYALDRNPCGSSSGSGVAVAADLTTVAIGSETDGSIVCPSGANGDVGIKPTLGLISRTGVVPISAEQDTAGPIARNTTDAAVLLGVLAGIAAGVFAAKSSGSARILAWVGLGLIALVVVASITLAEPINSKFRRLPEGQIPERAEQYRITWRRFHAWRTVTALAALACLAAAAV